MVRLLKAIMMYLITKANYVHTEKFNLALCGSFSFRFDKSHLSCAGEDVLVLFIFMPTVPVKCKGRSRRVKFSLDTKAR